MDSIFIYFLKVNVLISIFTLLFLFAYKRETHFQLNRFFLLVAMVSALLIPAIRISTQTIQSFQIPVNEFVIPEFIEEPLGLTGANVANEETQGFSWLLFIKAVYFLGVAILGLRFVLFLVKL